MDFISIKFVYIIVNRFKHMENVVKNFNLIKQEIIDKKNVKLVAVTKTFPISHILPVINEGHTDFGENKVQEAIEKWTSIKQDFSKINLHLIGKLQTNKVKFILPLLSISLTRTVTSSPCLTTSSTLSTLASDNCDM